MRKRNERIVQDRLDWRKQTEVKKLHIVMIVVAVFLCISIAAGAVLAWMQVKRESFRPTSSSLQSSEPVSEGANKLPIYDDSFNLLLVGPSRKIPNGYRPELTGCDSVQVDARIVPALSRLMEAARQAECPLLLTSGYVDAQTQEKRYQAEVSRIMASEKLSQVRAEDKAQASVGRSGYDESETGLAVDFSAPRLKSGGNFTSTAQYCWLTRNSVNYGFILRYPEDASAVDGVNRKTGCTFRPTHFRYVGTENALKMREYSMCLEEYVSYLSNRN